MNLTVSQDFFSIIGIDDRSAIHILTIGIEFSVTPIYRKTREVQFAAGGRQIAPTFPLIDARISGNAHSS